MTRKKSVTKVITPEEAFKKATEYCLEGRRPSTLEEWEEIIYNVVMNCYFKDDDNAIQFVLHMTSKYSPECIRPGYVVGFTLLVRELKHLDVEHKLN